MAQIYSSFAFTADEREKMRSNHELYQELKGKYKIYRYDTKQRLIDGEDVNFSEYDIVIGRKAGYAHTEYKIYKNAPKLSNLELALICDLGNLCFGYMMRGDIIHVFED